jgi:glutamine amidotransferase
LHDAVAEWARRMSAMGSFNFLLSNGERLFAHCATQLAYILRQAPFSRARLSDSEMEADFSELTTPADRVAVIATVPLTDNETWTLMQPGKLACFVDGAPQAR